MGNLVPVGQAGKPRGIDIAQQAVEEGSLRLEVVSLDIDETAVAGCHEQRQSPVTGGFANEDLHVQGVALFDDDVQSVKELVEIFGGEAARQNLHRQIGIELGDPSRRHHGLVLADIQHASRNAVEVGELEIIEVSQPQFAAQA